jgi:endonuclease/exonuclease/phosphatase family metal-dependent hydrolase
MFASSLLFIPLFLALASAVRGDGGTTPCNEAAPWLLEETSDTVRRMSLAGSADLEVVTYNLHSGLGSRHALFRSRAQVEENLRLIARAIAAAATGGPDVVGLNEVDFGSRRSGWIDQARFVAEELETITGSSYRVVRGETWRRDVPGLEVRFGNAALVRLPILAAQACRFDDLDRCASTAAESLRSPRRRSLLGRLLSEPRGVIRITVELHDRIVDLLITHLDAFDMSGREAQAQQLVTRLLIPGRTTVLLGDMNAVPVFSTGQRWMFSADRTHAILATGSLADASIVFASHCRQKSLAAWATYPAAAPIWGLDWVLASLDLAPQAVAAIGDTASDHRGLYVGYEWLRGDAEVDASRRRHERICERLRAYDSNCAIGG